MLVSLNKDKNNMKKFLGILVLTFMWCNVGAAATVTTHTYLKCKNSYMKLGGQFLHRNYNIRTKKFMDYHRIDHYGENFIRAEGYRLNRNTGEFSYGKTVLAVCNKIDFIDLPKLNAEGKKF